MQKPGSHRGAAKVKKKRYAQGEKKKPIEVIDRLRKVVSETKLQAEQDDVNNRYVRNYLSCHELADKFKCTLGDVIVCVNKLMHEGLTSGVSKRHKTFTVVYDKPKQEEEWTEIDSIFRFDDCPICGSKLKKNDVHSKFWQQGFILKQQPVSMLTGFNDECENKCFSHVGYKSNNGEDIIKVKVFDKKFDFEPNMHKSIKNTMVKDIEKEINRMKKNERYVVEIMMNNL